MDNTVVEKKKKHLKKLVRITVIAGCSLVVLLAVLWIVSLFLKRDRIPTRIVEKGITFSSVNYNADIFDDPVYVGKERDLTYLEYGTGSLIGKNYTGEGEWRGIAPESEYAKNCAEAAFFRNYFICLISGDYDAYRGFFTDNFFKYYTIPDKFTMQKVYDITVDLYDREEIGYNGETAIVERYIVTYKIMNNNATFRGDMGSDAAKPLYFKLLKYKGVIRIDSITFIKEKKA